MCGILAFYAKNGAASVPPETFRAMLAQLGARGPDQSSSFVHENVGLGHTRLSIIDLTTGSQPIFNETRDVACILNGEIYNFIDLREGLTKRGHQFKTNSDTEVIVHLYEEAGEEAFAKLEGMFAIVIYDLRRNILFVARDRIGEKPVYYHHSDSLFLCGSELKALLKHPRLSRELDPHALASYLEGLYIPAPLSIFKAVRKLEPGRYLKITQEGLVTRSFWSPQIAVDPSLDERAAIEMLRTLLSASVRQRLVADVPLGVFLSGGIDSSAVVAFMAQHATAPIKTYAVGFHEEIDELPYARRVAEFYGTQHTEIVIKSNLIDELPNVAAYFDEPFGDSSAVPTYAISREARKHVKVALTGDGGDELFAGYPHYIGQKYYCRSRIASRLARSLDVMASKMVGTCLLEGLYPFFQDDGADLRWRKEMQIFTSLQVRSLLRRDLWPETNPVNGPERLRIISRDPLSAAFEHDVNLYLPDDLLKKVDMASMAHGLECRAPFLDHKLVEFALSISPRLKLRGNITKYLLRKAIERDVPEGIAWRSKHGFGAPITSWLRSDMHSLLADLLKPTALVNRVLNPTSVRALIEQWVRTGDTANWRQPLQLWSILMLELWMHNYAK